MIMKIYSGKLRFQTCTLVEYSALMRIRQMTVPRLKYDIVFVKTVFVGETVGCRYKSLQRRNSMGKHSSSWKHTGCGTSASICLHEFHEMVNIGFECHDLVFSRCNSPQSDSQVAILLKHTKEKEKFLILTIFRLMSQI